MSEHARQKLRFSMSLKAWIGRGMLQRGGQAMEVSVFSASRGRSLALARTMDTSFSILLAVTILFLPVIVNAQTPPAPSSALSELQDGWASTSAVSPRQSESPTTEAREDHSPHLQERNTNHHSLLRILRSSHPLDFSRDDWQSLGRDIEERLLSVSSDRKEIYGARVRALHALAQLRSEAGRQLTLAFVDSENTPLPLRAGALETLARWWSVDDARPRALRLLESSEPALRRSAKEALRLIDGQ